MYAGLWRHARSLTVGAVCVALSVAGHLVGGGSAPDLAHAPVAALGLAVMTALRCLARRAGDHPGRSDALPRALATRHPCILPASDRRHERFSVLLLHRATRRPLRRTRPSALLGRPRPSGPPRGRAPSRALHLPAGRAAGVLLVAALTLAGAFTSAVTSAAPASAHAVLVKASPADGAVLSTAPRSVVLQFDDPISTSFATLTVTGPDGRTVSQEKALVSGTTVSGALADGLAPGRYRTVFRVVSEDGHPVNGQLTFTLKLPGGRRAVRHGAGGHLSRGGRSRPLSRRRDQLDRGLVPGRRTIVVGRPPAPGVGGAPAGGDRRRGPAPGPAAALIRPGFRGAPLLLLTSLLVAPLAQLAEQLTLNQRVRGSSP